MFNKLLLNQALETVFSGHKDTLFIDDQGIVSFWPTYDITQKDEQKMRDQQMKKLGHKTKEQILQKVYQHHCAAVMRARAVAFRSKFSTDDWIIDIGGGTGWYWQRTSGAPVVLVDFSLEMLRTAHMLLNPADNVLLVHADASRLPVSSASIDGLWSVQVFQHFPEEQFSSTLTELKRILSKRWYAEIYNLNPAFLHRCICWITKRQFHRRGQQGDLFLNRLTADEWKSRFRQLCRELGSDWEIKAGYSELFFHPNFLPIMRRYPLWLENLLTKNAPRFVSLFARQVQLIIRQH